MAARKRTGATLVARKAVAGRGARHTAVPYMGTRPCTTFDAWCARLVTLEHTSQVLTLNLRPVIDIAPSFDCATHLAFGFAKSAVRTVMAAPRTSVVASPEWSAANFVALQVVHNTITQQIRDITTAACSWTTVTACQRCSAGSSAEVSFSTHILGTRRLNLVATSGDRLRNGLIAMKSLKIPREVASNLVFEMTAWKLHLVQNDHALATVFSARLLLAGMATRVMSSLAGLFTSGGFMYSS